MSRVLGINAVFHDPASALVIDGRIAAAAEEERFSRRKHGKAPVAFSTWEVPERSARWCLSRGDTRARDLDAVAYSYDPDLAPPCSDDVTDLNWEGLRTLYVKRAPLFLRSALPGLDPERVRFTRPTARSWPSRPATTAPTRSWSRRSAASTRPMIRRRS